MNTNRNSRCPCGSGRRYKHCCGVIQEHQGKGAQHADAQTAHAADEGSAPDPELLKAAVFKEMKRWMDDTHRSGHVSVITVRQWTILDYKVGEPEPYNPPKHYHLEGSNPSTIFYPVRLQVRFDFITGKFQVKTVDLYCYYDTFKEFICKIYYFKLPLFDIN